MTPRHAPGFAVALRFAIAALLLASFGADGATAQATGPRVSLRLPHQMKGSLDPQVLERYAEDPTNPMLERHLYLATPRSLGGAGFMPITQDAPGDDGARKSVGSQRIASTDVNDDGVKDLLLIAHWVRTRSHEVLERQLRFAAVDGATGSTLWNGSLFDITGELYLDAEDVDGDGVLDVIAFDSGWDVDLFTDGLRSYSLDQVVTITSGADGSTLWRRVQAGSVSVVQLLGHRVEEGIDIVWTVHPFRAAANEGMSLLVTTRTWREAGVRALLDPFGRHFRGSGKVCSTTADVLDATTGAARWSVEQGARPDCQSVGPVGDRSGDGISDLAYLSSTGVELWGRYAPLPLWVRPLKLDDWFIFLRPAPLLSAAELDIHVLGFNIYNRGDGWFEYALDHSVGLASDTGETLHDRWAQSYVDLAGSVDGEGGEDFYDITIHDSGARAYSVFAGSDGKDLWTATPPGLSFGLADVSGDGARDVIAGRPEASGYVVTLIDGASGAELWRATRWMPRVLPGDDAWGDGSADADAGADFYSLTSPAPDVFELALENGMTSIRLWSTVFPRTSYPFPPAIQGAFDVDGQGFAEVLIEQRVEEGSALTYEVTRLIGEQGARWLYDSRLFFAS